MSSWKDDCIFGDIFLAAISFLKFTTSFCWGETRNAFVDGRGVPVQRKNRTIGVKRIFMMWDVHNILLRWWMHCDHATLRLGGGILWIL
mmetsp:Transcript_37029/g.54389  ORF Transcript_37029/g.54389 Transcript_37029/m.54389 type:complete len:89 (+) Transcript_37029:407-673(+)